MTSGPDRSQPPFYTATVTMRQWLAGEMVETRVLTHELRQWLAYFEQTPGATAGRRQSTTEATTTTGSNT
jgi:hypothetical protein